eukprot:360322-Chlamydomonas_euryale.AAC.9
MSMFMPSSSPTKGAIRVASGLPEGSPGVGGQHRGGGHTASLKRSLVLWSPPSAFWEAIIQNVRRTQGGGRRRTAGGPHSQGHALVGTRSCTPTPATPSRGRHHSSCSARSSHRSRCRTALRAAARSLPARRSSPVRSPVDL